MTLVQDEKVSYNFFEKCYDIKMGSKNSLNLEGIPVVRRYFPSPTTVICEAGGCNSK